MTQQSTSEKVQPAETAPNVSVKYHIYTLTEHKLAEMAHTVEQLQQMITDQRELYDTRQGKIGSLASQVAQITDTISGLAGTVADIQGENGR